MLTQCTLDVYSVARIALLSDVKSVNNPVMAILMLPDASTLPVDDVAAWFKNLLFVTGLIAT